MKFKHLEKLSVSNKNLADCKNCNEPYRYLYTYPEVVNGIEVKHPILVIDEQERVDTFKFACATGGVR